MIKRVIAGFNICRRYLDKKLLALDRNPLTWLVLGLYNAAFFLFIMWVNFGFIASDTLVSIVTPRYMLQYLMWILLTSNTATWCFTLCVKRRQEITIVRVDTSKGVSA